MPTYRLVSEFQENNGASFSEVFYIDGSSIQQVLTIGPLLTAARLNLLDPLNKWLQIRVSAISGLRQTGVIPINKQGTNPRGGGPLPVGASIIVKLGSSAGGSRQWWIRGGSGNDYVRDSTTGIDKVPAALQTNLESCFNLLSNNLWGILTLVKPNGAGVQYQNVTQIDGMTLPGKTIITLDAAPVFAKGATVSISGASKKDLPALTGHYQVLAVAGNTFTINYVTPEAQTLKPPGVRVKAVVYNATAVITPSLCAFSHLGTHTSKNPITRSRGARRAARIRLLG